MTPPRKTDVASIRDWQAVCSAAVPALDPARLLVVHTPSASAYVEENFRWAGGSGRLVIASEPAAADFARLETLAAAPSLVIGIGGGKALDAAKAAAYWGTAFASSRELGQLLAADGKIDVTRGAGLVLAPSIASSGSESSRAAIVSVDGRKTGLRGAGLTADTVVHDSRLWTSLTEPVAWHYAFDILAHLLETTVSLRRSAVSIDYAREGFARLGHWLFRQDGSLAEYQEAMDAAYFAGACLATSSTCLPHRIQYVIGPATDTSHVEGIWYLSPGWLEAAARKCPDRLADAAAMLRPTSFGLAGLREAFSSIHERARSLVRQERFKDLPGAANRLARDVNGDVSADPIYDGAPTIEALIQGSAA